jgi:hypothetical protein
MKDWSNQAVFSVLGYNHENENKHKLIGKVAFHVHKLVKVGSFVNGPFPEHSPWSID